MPTIALMSSGRIIDLQYSLTPYVGDMPGPIGYASKVTPEGRVGIYCGNSSEARINAHKPHKIEATTHTHAASVLEKSKNEVRGSRTKQS